MTYTTAAKTEGERKQPRFSLGQIVSTRGALAACTAEHLQQCLARHLKGDWGSVCAEDKESNDEAVTEGLRLLSAYPIDPAKPSEGFGENTLWIITEAASGAFQKQKRRTDHDDR
jgi:hypothetical protein